MNPRHRAWSPAAETKLRELYASTPLSRLAFMLKRTEKAVRSRAKVLGIQRGSRRPWSRDEDQLLKRRYPNERTADIARCLGRELTAVYQHAKNIGLRKSAEFLASPAAGRTNGRQGMGSRFPKGHVPANKGLRRPGWAPGRMRETQFKKGRPAYEARNYVPIGSERLSKDGYLERKITDDSSLVPARRWVGVHRLMWMEANGPIPPGHIVTFRNGDKTDRRLENFELITLRENAQRNSFHKLPAPLPQMIMLRAQLNRKINKRTRAHEEQNGRPA
jgi:hypothetical protein